MPRFSVLVFLLFLTGCNLPGQAAPASPTPDKNLLATQGVATVYANLTASAPPTQTSTQAVASATPALAQIYFSGDTNCRRGPGIKFELVTVIQEGQTAELAGQPKQGDYWVVKSPNGPELCWVVRDFATSSGLTDKLTAIEAPPTYTAMPAPVAPVLAGWDYSCEYTSADSQSTSTITVRLVWQDSSAYELGYNVYRNGELMASLPPNATAYTDVTYLAYQQGVAYFVEAWNFDHGARSKEVKAQCQ